MTNHPDLFPPRIKGHAMANLFAESHVRNMKSYA